MLSSSTMGRRAAGQAAIAGQVVPFQWLLDELDPCEGQALQAGQGRVCGPGAIGVHPNAGPRFPNDAIHQFDVRRAVGLELEQPEARGHGLARAQQHLLGLGQGDGEGTLPQRRLFQVQDAPDGQAALLTQQIPEGSLEGCLSGGIGG